MNCVFYVYALLNPDTLAPFYIGKGKGRRCMSHRYDARGNSHKANIIQKYLQQGKKVPIVKIVDGISENAAFEIEKAVIESIGRYPHGPLVNKTDGGEGVSGWKKDAELVAKMAEFHRGRKRSDQTRQAISENSKARDKNKEWVTKISDSLRGRKMSDEQKAKISESLKGRPCASGTRAALIETNKKMAGIPWSDEKRAKIMEGRRKAKEARL